VNGCHSEMLAKILEAAAQEPESGNALADALSKIAVTLNTQTEALVKIGGMINGIGPSVETAVVRGFHRAVGTVDENGVIVE
jgi:hypothetical protein